MHTQKNDTNNDKIDAVCAASLGPPGAPWKPTGQSKGSSCCCKTTIFEKLYESSATRAQNEPENDIQKTHQKTTFQELKKRPKCSPGAPKTEPFARDVCLFCKNSACSCFWLVEKTRVFRWSKKNNSRQPLGTPLAGLMRLKPRPCRVNRRVVSSRSVARARPFQMHFRAPKLPQKTTNDDIVKIGFVTVSRNLMML